MHERGVDVSAPLMVGDRGYDVLSAAAEGVPTIHVLWGYGTPDESAEQSRPLTPPGSGPPTAGLEPIATPRRRVLFLTGSLNHEGMVHRGRHR